MVQYIQKLFGRHEIKINPYDPCVANKCINEKQCTVCWYVDDAKISHEDKGVVDQVILSIEEKFGKMTVTRGKKHSFVGMDIEFKINGTVALSMDEYIKECIDIYGNKIKKSASSPAKGNLFDEDEGDEAKIHNEDLAEKFHHTTAKLLYT